MGNLFPFTIIGTGGRMRIYCLLAEVAVINAILIAVYTTAIALSIKAVF